MSSENPSPSSEGVDPRQAALDAARAQWLTITEAAYVLRTDKHTILNAIHQGHVKLFAVGKVFRVHVDALVESQKVMGEWKPVRLKSVQR